MRKSFILHKDSLAVLNELTDEQAGQLFKAISAHQNSEAYELSGLMKAIFTPFKNQFDRDNENYQNTVERNRANGLNGGRPPKPKQTQDNPKNPSGYLDNPSEPKKADSDSDSDNNKTKLNIYLAEQFEIFWRLYNKGSKKVSRERFMKLTPTEVGKIQKHLKHYFAANPEVKFRKDAERYISHKLWETEIAQATLPEGWFNMDLTPEQMKLVPEEKLAEKKRHDVRRQMGI